MATTGEARALPFFTDLYGQPLESGSIFIGQAGLDPISYPAVVTSDVAGSTVLVQPIRTVHGRATSAGALVHMFCPVPYSITVLDSAGRTVYASLKETDPTVVAISQSSVQSAPDLNTLRARDKNVTNQVWVNGYGMYVYEPGDTTSPESLPSIVVGNDGGRYYLFGGFGIYGKTAPQFDKSLLYATTEFAMRALGSRAGLPQGLNVPTTLTAASAGFMYVIVAAVAITLPAAASVAAGTEISFMSQVAGASVVRQGSNSIFAGSSVLTSITLNAGDTIVVVSNGLGWYVRDGSSALPYSATFVAAVANAVAAQALGVGQTWQNVLASRAANTTYTNSTGRTIYVLICAGNSGGTVTFSINGTPVSNTANGNTSQLSAPIPSGSTYGIGPATSLLYWNELR